MRRWSFFENGRGLLFCCVLCAGALAAGQPASGSGGVSAAGDPGADIEPLATPSYLYPSDDAYVDSHDPTANFGIAPMLATDISHGYQTRRSYLKFSFSSIPATAIVTKATLYLYYYDTVVIGGGGSPDLQVCGVDDDTWTEGTITWKNQPSFGLPVDSHAPRSKPGWSTWDVTSLAQATQSADHVLSLVVKPDDNDGSYNPGLAYSKDLAGTSLIPHLEIYAEQRDYGDAPYHLINDTYHVILPGLCLGTLIDAELKGQPDPNALGDDLNGLDDEDGVVFTSLLVPGQTASADVTVSAPGYAPYLCAWIDFNKDGVWQDFLGECIFSGSVAIGVNRLTFDVPATAVPGATFARFRLYVPSAVMICSPWGPATNLYGEMEDYQVVIEDANALDFGDAPYSYSTVLANDGARHKIVTGVFLGNRVDGEQDGQPDPNALGDDLHGYRDDEDGVVFTSLLVCGTTACVDVTASFNADGDWSSPDECIFSNRPLASGPNTLTFDVPATAVLGHTYARFRFSTSTIPGFVGLCADGEVEDYEVCILARETPKSPGDRLPWTQPPLESDPINAPGQYCGGYDPASYGPVSGGGLQIAADDFVCLGAMPISSVHWWGSYPGWRDLRAPSPRPISFRIGFWSNVAAGAWFHNRPGILLSQVDIPISRVTEEWVGFSESGSSLMPDSCFRYQVDLDAAEYFQQDKFLTSTTDNMFWISIVAVYQSAPALGSGWQWKSRPCAQADAGVRFHAASLTPGFVLDPKDPSLSLIQLVQSEGAWVKFFDLAFELDTQAQYVKWAQPFTQLRDWPHYEDRTSIATWAASRYKQDPDLTSTGVDVAATFLIPPIDGYADVIVSDDFSSTAAGLLAGITIWGSWEGDILPKDHPSNMTFDVSIRADNAGVPGNLLWSQQFSKSAFSMEALDGAPEGFYDPNADTYSASNHTKVYKYDLRVDSSKSLSIAGTPANPKVYWLSVQTEVVLVPGSMGAARFGWKTSKVRVGNGACWVQAYEPYSGSWNGLEYPWSHPSRSQPMDMAFAISLGPQVTAGNVAVQELVADDWQCQSLSPVTGLAWWGSYQGYACSFCSVPGSQVEPPLRPDYFLLSIWSDVPNPNPADPSQFSHPGTKLWEYEARDYTETLVGLDKHPHGDPNEAVFRYSVRLPEANWFRQPTVRGIYWLSIVAVYQMSGQPPYPWGWTNHTHQFNDDAVKGTPLSSPSGAWTWQPLRDQTGVSEDMSFMLFSEPIAW
jgi:hypothetical protein